MILENYNEIYNWTLKLNQGINNIFLNESISCKKGYMILLKNVEGTNNNQIIFGERNIQNSQEDLKIISNINNSLSFDSNSTRVIFRFCVKLQITRFYFSYSNNYNIYFPKKGFFSIKA